MKTTLKIAIASAFAMSNMAHAIEADLQADPATSILFASELLQDGDTVFTAGIAGDQIRTDMGFGGSGGDLRFYRYEFTNAVFTGNMVNGAISGATIAPASAQVVSDGLAGDSCVAYQGNLNAGTPGNSDVLLDLIGGMDITSAAQPIGVTYTLHETGASASCDGPQKDNALLSNPVVGTVSDVESAVTTTVTPNTLTSDVNTGYLDTVENGDDQNLAQVDIGLTANVVDPATGVAPLPAALFAATGSTINVTGNFSAGATNLDTNIACPAVPTAPPNSSPGVIAADLQSAEYNIDVALANINIPFTGYLCYNTDGVTEIEESQYLATTSVAAAAGATVVDLVSEPVGEIVKNGLVLKVPFASGGYGGARAYVNLVNTSNLDANYTVECFSTGGPTGIAEPSASGTSGVIEAGKSKLVFASQYGCPSGVIADGDAESGVINSVSSYNSVEFIFDVPRGSVTGTYIRENVSNGAAGMSDLTGNQ